MKGNRMEKKITLKNTIIMLIIKAENIKLNKSSCFIYFNSGA